MENKWIKKEKGIKRKRKEGKIEKGKERKRLRKEMKE